MAPRGRFITLEGGEGAGKSTQVRALATALQGRGHDVLTTREPGGTPGAEALRGLLVAGDAARWTPLAEALIHMAARAEHVERVVLPALAAGRWVLCDRFVHSTAAYQGVVQGLGLERIWALHQAAFGTLMPDLTLVLDLDPAAGLARAEQRGGDSRYERMGPGFHRALRAAFQHLVAADPAHLVLVDAGGPPAAVTARLLAAIDQQPDRDG